MVTYKRIKKPNRGSCKAGTYWEFQDEMDEVYRIRSDVTVPQKTLDLSLLAVLSGTADNNDYPVSQYFSMLSLL